MTRFITHCFPSRNLLTNLQSCCPSQLTEMSALLLMGEYYHARHLYRRYGSSSSSFFSSPSSSDTMEILWNLTQALLLKNTPRAFSVLVHMKSLSELNPLSEKLSSVVRERTAHHLAIMYKKLRPSFAAKQLGFPATSVDNVLQYLKQLGWTTVQGTSELTKDEMFLVPPSAKSKLSSPFSANTSASASISDMEHKLQTLTEVVAFLEQKRTNT